MNGRRRSWLGFLVLVTMSGVLASAGTASSSPASPAKPGRIQEFAVPTPDADLIGIAAGGDGNIWFAEDFVGKVGRVTPDGVVTEFPIPKGVDAWNMAPGPDGNVWFTTDSKYVGECHRPATSACSTFPHSSTNPRSPTTSLRAGMAPCGSPA